MKKKKTILVAPLNWGLGHATRCIPIIRELLKQNANVIIGADGMALDYLKREFPALESITIPDLKVRYPKSGGYLLYFALRIPRLFNHVKKEHQSLKKIVRDYKIDGIVSDNRYGLYHASKPSVLITHQLFIETPSFKKTVHTIVKKLVSKFNECWIPDVEGSGNLSGRLSHAQNMPATVKYIGTLSRFSPQTKQAEREVLAILSGPEPFRTTLEEILITKLTNLKCKALLVRGVVTKSKEERKVTANLTVVGYLSSNNLLKEVEKSEFVIARSGYSSIMDLAALQQKALLIPTPGQTEQEYLAQHLLNHPLFVFSNQDSIDLHASFEVLRSNSTQEEPTYSGSSESIRDFLANC